MTRAVRLSGFGCLVLFTLAGCGRGFFQSAEREPWRAEAEVACLKSGTVKENADLVRIDPISGPGICGAQFPLKVAALGESNGSFGFADELRPPGSIGGQPRWPVGQQPVPRPSYPQAATSRSYPQSYPGSNSVRGPVSLSPSVAAPDDDDIDLPSEGSSASSELPQYRTERAITDQQPRGARPYPQSEPYSKPRLGPQQGNPVTALGPVEIKPTATLACPIVSALDRWLGESVQPAAIRWFGARVAEIKQISAYSCRGMNGNSNAHISEHAFGNALDIASFTLADGRRISVKDGWKGLPEEQGFLRDVHGSACQNFNTVLAPGSNIYHYDHIHVDLMRRASGRVICQPAAVSGEEIAARASPARSVSRDMSRDSGITGSIGRKTKRTIARGPLSKADRDSIEDESRIKDRD